MPAALAYRTYLETKYQLHREWEWIDWEHFQNAATKYSSWGPAMNKYLHGWLATAENVKRRNPHNIQTCPFCSRPETTSHIFQCNAPGPRNAILSAATKLWETLSEFLCPNVIAEIKRHIMGWIDGTECDIQTDLDFAITEQYAIGWSQFLRGRITDQFYLFIRDRLTQQGHTNSTKAASKKITRMIHAIWDCAMSLWKTRNELASTSTVKTPSIQRQCWSSMATFYYNNQHQFPDFDRRTIFSHTLNELLQKSDQYLSRWCRQVASAFHQSVTRTMHLTRNTHRLITNFVIDTARPPG